MALYFFALAILLTIFSILLGVEKRKVVTARKRAALEEVSSILMSTKGISSWYNNRYHSKDKFNYIRQRWVTPSRRPAIKCEIKAHTEEALLAASAIDSVLYGKSAALAWSEFCMDKYDRGRRRGKYHKPRYKNKRYNKREILWDKLEKAYDIS